MRPSGIVKSLAIGDPADGAEALATVCRTGGRIEAVDDQEVVEAIELLARTTGVFGETAAGSPSPPSAAWPPGASSAPASGWWP